MMRLGEIQFQVNQIVDEGKLILDMLCIWATCRGKPSLDNASERRNN